MPRQAVGTSQTIDLTPVHCGRTLRGADLRSQIGTVDIVYNPHMGHHTAWILAAFLIASSVAGSSEFAGTWEGNENGLPSVELTVQDKKGEITGSIGFYFQARGTDGKWHLGEKMTVPLLSPKIEGRVLTFETIHYKKHGSRELGPNNKYRVEFRGAKEARLQIVRDQTKEDDSGLKLTRRE